MLAAFGMKSEQIDQTLVIEDFEDFTVDPMATLRGMSSALKSGSVTIEEMLIGTA
ncbi:hypothetical protein [Bartonella rattaustraliani]|uniref:hypothetical protein n=1 Tax=Bartonella rattaustraliani TaxID=481139 RepID=UPI00030B6C39|nr:hypothetical protein [Bartonella rattaustraliani]